LKRVMEMHETLAFFGAFNPPTVAHIRLAEFAMREAGAQNVLFVPSKSGYIRDSQQKDFAFQDEDRLAMLDKIAKTRPWMQKTDWEIRQESQPRTYHTLCALRDGGVSASLLMGSDKLKELENGWRFVPEICREFGIVCLARGEDNCRQTIQSSPFLQNLSPFIQVLETPDEFRGVSSTAVRKLLLRKPVPEEELSRMVPEEILPLLIHAANKGGSL